MKEDITTTLKIASTSEKKAALVEQLIVDIDKLFAETNHPYMPATPELKMFRQKVTTLTTQLIQEFKAEDTDVILKYIGPVAEKLLFASCIYSECTNEFKQLLQAFPCLAFHHNHKQGSLFHRVFDVPGDPCQGIYFNEFKILLNAVEQHPELKNKYGIPFNQKNTEDETPLHLLFKFYGFFLTPFDQTMLKPDIQTMLELGADPFIKNNNDTSALELLKQKVQVYSEIRSDLAEFVEVIINMISTAKANANEAIFEFSKPLFYKGNTNQFEPGAGIQKLKHEVELVKLITNRLSYQDWMKPKVEEKKATKRAKI